MAPNDRPNITVERDASQAGFAHPLRAPLTLNTRCLILDFELARDQHSSVRSLTAGTRSVRFIRQAVQMWPTKQ